MADRASGSDVERGALFGCWTVGSNKDFRKYSGAVFRSSTKK